ncbi:dipeptidase [Polymorphobacter sp.]|uniref:dipeptidase n=1 Tax=Polymorphobacter sp. TaxID=1909290 RepID=UPI003F6FDBA9
MIRVLAWLVGLVLVAAAAFLALAPGIAERNMNGIAGAGTWPVSPAARALHARLTIVDLHADTLMWQRDVARPSTRGHVDLPRLQAGNVAIQVFSSVTKTPKNQNYEANSGDTDNITLLAVAQLQPRRTWDSLLERSLWHAQKLDRAVRASDGMLWKLTSTADIDRLLAERDAGRLVTGAILSTEGAHNLEGRLENVARLHVAGFRMMGLVHFFDNEVGGSMHGMGKGGLTVFGRRVVAEMERRGIIVDLAHASRQTLADVLAVARRPVVVSHGGVKATCDTPRNLDDDQLRALAANGGMVGIGYWDAAVCKPTPDAVARAIVHAVRVMGIDHVGLGSDFDGAVTTGFDAAHIDAVTAALLRAGLGEAEIGKVMGGNALRLLRAGLVPERGSA